jgi:plasmid stabilization system protein ParE
MKVIWDPDAEGNLQSILQKLLAVNPQTAANWLDGLESRILDISKVPEIGRVFAHYGDDLLREVVYGRYRIIYLVLKNRVEIQAPWHGARRPPGRGIAGELGDE